MQCLLPLALISILVAILSSMPSSRSHPNHVFMIDLLNAEPGEDSATSASSFVDVSPVSQQFKR